MALALRCVLPGTLLMLVAPIGAFLTFTVNPQSREVPLNSSAVLSCEAADGAAIVGWLFNDTSDLPAGADVASGVLRIEAFQPSNAGVYRCIASNNTIDRQVSHQAKLSYFAQRAFTVQPADFTSYVLRASTVRAPAGFDCVLASYQPNGVRPVVGWEIVQSDGTREFHDPRQSGGRFVALQLDHHGYLQIVDPQTADNGTRVRCVATSSLNPSEMAALSNWASILVSELPRPDSLPVFSTQPPPTVYPVPGMDMVLPCSKTTSNSSLSIIWRESNATWSNNFFFWGFPLPLPPDYSIVGYSNLQVFSPQAHIGTTFACVAYNAEGLQSTAITSTVIIASPPPSTTPTYEDHLYTYVVQSGTTLSLPLGVATNSTARWLWNAQLVSLGSKYSISPGDQRLVIRDVQPGDSGVYQGGVQVTQGGQDIDVLATYEITVYSALNISCEDHINGTQLVVSCSFNVPVKTVQCSLNQGPFYVCSFPLLLPTTTSVLSLTITAADVHGSVATVTLTPANLDCDGVVSTGSHVILISCQAAFVPIGYTISKNGSILGNGFPPYNLSILTLDAGVHTFLITATTGLTGASTLVTVTVPAYHQCHTPSDLMSSVSCSSNFPLLGAQCTIDVGPTTPCSFPLNTSTLAPGTHSITISSGTLSSTASFILQGLPPLVPHIDQLHVLDKGRAAIYVHWTANATLLRPVSSYDLQVTSTSAPNQTLTLTNTSYTLTMGVVQGHTYAFQVRAVNAYGSGNYSDPRTLMVPNNGSPIPWWVWLIVALLLLLALLLCCVFCCCLALCCFKKGKQQAYNVKEREEDHRKDVEAEYQTTV